MYLNFTIGVYLNFTIGILMALFIFNQARMIN